LGILFGSTVAVRRRELQEFVSYQREFAADMQQSRGFDHSHQVRVQMHRFFACAEALVTVVDQHVAALVAVQPDRSELARIDGDLSFPTSQQGEVPVSTFSNLSV
jgi:hypothetical protein